MNQYGVTEEGISIEEAEISQNPRKNEYWKGVLTVSHLKASNLTCFRLLHDAKNHLASLKLLVRLLEPTIQGEPYNRYLRLLKKEVSSIESMLDLDEGIKGHALVSIASLLEELKELFESRADKKGIQAVLSLSCPGLIWGDRDLLKDALYNVWQNAIDAMGDRGTVTIKIWKEERDSETSSVCVSFSDTGPGIPQNLLPSLPKPFVTTKKGGLGLGLSIAHAIAATHGGSMDIQSDSTGTTVIFSFPVSMTPMDSAPPNNYLPSGVSFQ